MRDRNFENGGGHFNPLTLGLSIAGAAGLFCLFKSHQDNSAKQKIQEEKYEEVFQKFYDQIQEIQKQTKMIAHDTRSIKELFQKNEQIPAILNKQFTTCPSHHPLFQIRLFRNQYRITCNDCYSLINLNRDKFLWRCLKDCNYDICASCNNQAK